MRLETSQPAGCASRFIDLLVGIAAGWSCAALYFGRLADPPLANPRAELYGAALGALTGLLLPELVRLLERTRVPRDASRTAFSLIAAAILGAAYARTFLNGCIGALLALAFAACVLFFLDAAVGRSAGIITPLAQGARKELGKLLLKMAAGVLIGMTGGFLRIHMRVVAVGTSAEVQFFTYSMLAAGAVIYPLLLLVFMGRKALRGWQLPIAIVDGLFFAILTALVMMQPIPTGDASWNWIWVPLGMFLGLSMAVAFGSVQSILVLLLVNNRLAQFAGGVVADGVGDMLGRPRRPQEPVVEAPLTSGQRTASGCMGTISFLGILCFGLMALCFGGGEGMSQKDDRDLVRLPPGCPPSCAGGDFSGWSMARTGRFRGADFDGANLESAFLWGVDFTRTSFRKARMRRAKLVFATLVAADLTGADLRGAHLTGAKLQGARLTDANLEGALLQSADLSAAKLRNANLTDAIYNADTVWPPGFDPRAAGARIDGEERPR